MCTDSFDNYQRLNAQTYRYNDARPMHVSVIYAYLYKRKKSCRSKRSSYSFVRHAMLMILFEN